MERYAYPVEIVPEEDGGYFVRFPDVPEALTSGETQEEALEEARDALHAALGGYVQEKRDVPAASPARGRSVIALDTLTGAKLALYEGMREKGMTNVELGRLLGIQEGAVRRLLDLDHQSHIGYVEVALKEVGRSLILSVYDS